MNTCLLSSNQCYYCHPQKLSSCHCCSYSISIEEILTWIIICSLTLIFLYNTIKLCVITFLILSIIYWIYKQTNIPDMIKEHLNSWMNSKSSIDERESSDDNVSLNINTSIKQDDDNQELNPVKNENDDDQRSLSSKTLSNSSNTSKNLFPPN
jgi:hypothetical protein